MTTTVPIQPVVSTQQSTTVNRQRLLAAATWISGRTGDSRYTTLHDIEKMELAALRATSVKGNLFAVLQLALAEGNPAGGVSGISVPSNVGGVMDAFGINQTQTNQLACFCKNGDGVHPFHLASSLRTIAGVT